jgi:uncharacterized protein (TIGR00369 family)
VTDEERGPDDQRHAVGDYLRLERWEIVPERGSEALPGIGGRVPVDDHHRGSGGGLSAGALATAIDSLGGYLCGVSVQPRWIVTTNLMMTVARTTHRGPLAFRGRVLRRGRNAVVAALDVADEGDADRKVAAAVITCAVLESDEIDVRVTRPFSRPMPPADRFPAPMEEFFGINPEAGIPTRLDIGDRLRNPWGYLHGGGLAVLADVAACRAVAAESTVAAAPTAADMVLHFLRPATVGPVEAETHVLGGRDTRRLVRVALRDRGAADRLVTVASVAVRQG